VRGHLGALATGHCGIADDDDVLGLEIAMDDALGVRRVERRAGQPHDPEAVERCDRPIRASRLSIGSPSSSSMTMNTLPAV
jgi:hypothetical protein